MIPCTTCRGCQRRFTFILRRHHCRRCGKIYCDKCSSWRAVLDPDEIVHEPSIAASIPEGDSTPPCCREQSIRESSSNFDLGYGRGMLERIVIDRGRLYPRTTSFGRGRSSSQLSDLAECPVCNTSLDNVGSIAQQEAHVKNCLEGGNVNGATSVQSAKYLVYTLPETSALIGVECVICLEEFLKGSSVARLSCFCSFHTSCLTSWLQRGKACPVHSR
ncbi:hypothetical protein DL96DRAFT_971411 [Flagelloscypha sp. PMI_526]|nr:hypothetical protein DL96DRAFT_971411 [Flagelloscypha sp. PMI_526]